MFWLDTAASVFLPPLILHFCLEFPFKRRFFREHYRGAIAALHSWCASHGDLGHVRLWRSRTSAPLRSDFVRRLETVGDVHFVVYLVASAGVLFWTYRTVRIADLRQQMKWVTRGVALGVCFPTS